MKHTTHLHVVLDIFKAWNFTSSLTVLLIGIVLGVGKHGTTVGQFFSCVHTALKWSILMYHNIWNFIISQNLQCCALEHFNSCLPSHISYTHYVVELHSVFPCITTNQVIHKQVDNQESFEVNSQTQEHCSTCCHFLGSFLVSLYCL